jgi:hypothetical protein
MKNDKLISFFDLSLNFFGFHFSNFQKKLN